MVKRNQGARANLNVGTEKFTVDLLILTAADRFTSCDPGFDAIDDTAVCVENKPVNDIPSIIDPGKKAKTDEMV